MGHKMTTLVPHQADGLHIHYHRLFTLVFILPLALSVMLLAPHTAFAVTCNFGTDNGSGQCLGFVNAGTVSWNVPSDWSDTNKVECIGSGGGGSAKQSGTVAGGGGGGGAYAQRTNITSLSGSITTSVGAAGAVASTTFNASESGKEVVCDWGKTPSASGTGGNQGFAGGSIGDTKSSGGKGGTTVTTAGGGGGGAAGNSGAGGDGAASINGGNSNNGTLPGPSAQGTSGTAGTEYDATHGSGTGGAGGNGGGNKIGGTGGRYGGGGGGGNTGNSAPGGAGFAGLIIITYTPVVIPTVTTDSASAGVTSATLFGSIANTGGDDADESGFAYDTDTDLSSPIATTTLGAQSGAASFNGNVSSLSANTTYSYRAYATNSGGTGYGTIKEFTTGSDTVAPSRHIRLFGSFKLKIDGGKLKILKL